VAVVAAVTVVAQVACTTIGAETLVIAECAGGLARVAQMGLRCVAAAFNLLGYRELGGVAVDHSKVVLERGPRSAGGSPYFGRLGRAACWHGCARIWSVLHLAGRVLRSGPHGTRHFGVDTLKRRVTLGEWGQQRGWQRDGRRECGFARPCCRGV
jgi:hypothetical protein